MEVVLRIIDGPEKGQEFRFGESDNLLVGRKDPTSKAHVNLGPEDEYVSRHHFMIEVRPPNCLIRDHGSANGTFVRRKGGSAWERVQERALEDGDEIKVGHTVLAVQIILPEPVGIATKIDLQSPGSDMPPLAAQLPRIDSQPEMFCIRCQEPLADAPSPDKATFRDADFMCSKCRRLVEAEAAKKLAAPAAAAYRCSGCNRDMTPSADADGRAADLADVALYLCASCADGACKVPRMLIGDYRPLSELGRGGMGVVYKALHQSTGRLVALKLMLPQAKTQGSLVVRFVREVCIMGELRHPGVLRLYEAGQHGRDPYFTSELATEGSMDKFVSPRGETLLQPVEAARLIAACLDGLGFFHERGYVHRDIKPENILMRKHDGKIVPKLADFGLARSYEKHGGTITRTGEAAGTLYYMPPEQLISFKRCHPPVDIYAMGVALYYLLTARFPLEFPPPYEKVVRVKKDPVRMILEDPARPIRDRRKDLPPRLCSVVDKAVAKEAKQRYQTAKEFQTALREAIGE